MSIGIAIAFDRLISAINEFNPGNKYEIQLTDAEMIRECAAIIANATEEEIIDTLKDKKTKQRISNLSLSAALFPACRNEFESYILFFSSSSIYCMYSLSAYDKLYQINIHEFML